MRLPGRTARRLVVAILLAAVVPLMASIYIARSLVTRATSLLINADVGHELERSLGVYSDLAKAMKDAMRAKADAIAAREPLRAAVLLRHLPSIDEELAKIFPLYPDLVRLTIVNNDGDEIASRDRGRPVEGATERSLEVRLPLAEGESAATMIAVFAAPRARLDALPRADEFVREYRAIERQRTDVERWYLAAFAALVGITIAVSTFIASVLAGSVTGRIAALARATEAVGKGDLAVRVPEAGGDELADLAHAFNAMLVEVEESRARIEFLRRIGAWQDMARRLAHEIKNPLTPIQLAVEECHRRYPGDDPAYQRLLDTTLEIVGEEVGTLRRLVGDFGDFARMPRAELTPGDLGEFLREQRDRFTLGRSEADGDEPGLPPGITLSWSLPDGPMLVALDPLLLHRVLVNLVDNAGQAAASVHTTGGLVSICASTDGSTFVIDVDDNGPGVPVAMRSRIFDPYVTTKPEGNGLGLAIVKKIVVEHGGAIETYDAPLGGARFRLRLPTLMTHPDGVLTTALS